MFLFQSGEADADGKMQTKRPVMVHRAVLGSVERFVSVLAEQCAGKWPFWLSPRQALVVPIAAPFNEYAQKVEAKLRSAFYYVDSDLSTKTFNKKVKLEVFFIFLERKMKRCSW